MLKPIISSIFLLFAQPLYAEIAETSETSPIERCMIAGEFATAIMRARQSGTPIADLIEIADGDDIIIALILFAYGQPRYGSQEYQQRAAEEFTSEVVVACMSGLT